MGHKVLITGAGGYIGGSLITTLSSRNDSPLRSATIIAAVKSESQVERLSKQGHRAVQLDLSDEAAVLKAVLDYEVDIVVHTANSFNPGLASNLIKALGQRRKATGKNVSFIHSSVGNVYSAEAGWPYGTVSDADAMYDKEKKWTKTQGPHPVRDTNLLVVEKTRAEGVESFIVALPTVYGKGGGEFKKLSSNFPAVIKTSMDQGAVHIFDQDSNPALAHISDLCSLYALLVSAILNGEKLPSGENGYYLAMAHTASSWQINKAIAEALFSRKLISTPETNVWPSDEVASESLGWPLPFIRVMGSTKVQLKAVNAFEALQWKPKWDTKRLLSSMDDEIQSVQESSNENPARYDV